MLSQCLVLCLSLSFLIIGWSRRTGRFPPGPRGLPLIGNTLQIPQDRQWLKWAEWKVKYGSYNISILLLLVFNPVAGDVIRISILGTPTIILCSMQAAVDLLESRGNLYSTATMTGELLAGPVDWATLRLPTIPVSASPRAQIKSS
ncbi:hypothetical protein C8R45DRAFT_1037744 [Mycena sanguinolenta]|nr:hypothetical protein C8R45DRAFT_1037744 [Mycena sanguinolenta]